ncbi:hypothetical protein EsH8_III_000145 [Colletotrichum jinshuiense]
MKLFATIALLLAPLALFTTPASAANHRRHAGMPLRPYDIPPCVIHCMKELEYRLKEHELPRFAGDWCSWTAPPIREDFIAFGKKLDECKMVQCTNVRWWYDAAVWHWDFCDWHGQREESMMWFSDYRKSAWWPNEDGRPRPPGHESWISENRTARPY